MPSDPGSPPHWASAWGQDQYGRHAVLRVGEAEQVMRWIAPGTFLMGSPPDEPRRFDDEGPQHPVTISHGYWLADTPCTEAMWLAVLGRLPGRASDPSEVAHQPVRGVSRRDVQGFLAGLKPRLGRRWKPVLPTEVQWEHAARAGTTTPYWWGSDTGPGHADWDDDVGMRLRVKDHAPNPWGLYAVHGTVSEWCHGAPRIYHDRAEVDPPDLQHSPECALRGGSWFDSPSETRSAFRGRYLRQSNWFGIGFRFAIRPMKRRCLEADRLG